MSTAADALDTAGYIQCFRLTREMKNFRRTEWTPGKAVGHSAREMPNVRGQPVEIGRNMPNRRVVVIIVNLGPLAGACPTASSHRIFFRRCRCSNYIKTMIPLLWVMTTLT